ncbi:MAG: hypothetical protein AAFP82_22095 [Bacteroidota bacterium]
MIHKSTVENYLGTMEGLAEEIGDLQYDALATFLECLANKIQKDGDKDKGRGRIKLASHLHDCSEQLRACKSIDKAWVICKPHMK